MNNFNENKKIKEKVHDYWNQRSCGTDASDEEKFSIEYFEEIEHIDIRLSLIFSSSLNFQDFMGKKF